MRYGFKNDRYVKARGGNSHFLNLYCSKCGNHLALYQKDGPGRLLRIYLDRIFEPVEISGLQRVHNRKDDLPNLHCSKCGAVIGTSMVYEPENRLAFRLIHGSFSKKKSDGTYSPV